LLLLEGFRLMIVGMTVVALFLGLLVLAMNLSALFFTRFPRLFAEELPEGPGSDDGAEIAVAIAAVQAYGKRD